MFPAGGTTAHTRHGSALVAERSSSDGTHLESIYNLLPRIIEDKRKPPMYKSRVDHSREILYSTFCQKKSKSSMYGIKDGGRCFDPKHFLRVGEGIEARRRAGTRPELPPLSQGTGREAGAEHGGQVLPARRKPSVPRRDDRPTLGLASNKNFVTSNAVEAILAVPANRRQPPVDYLSKEDYGRVPEYLKHVRAEIRAENDMVEEFVREQMGISTSCSEDEEMRQMPSEEQEKLVDQLKAKWDDVNSRYQQLVHQTFFEHGRLEKKARMEKQLDELEADILKLTRGPVAVAP